MSKSRQERRAARRAEVKAERARSAASQPQATRPSRSRQLRAVRSLDPFHNLRDRLGQLGQKVGEWAGLPVPIEGQRVICAPQMPFAELYAPTAEQLAEGHAIAAEGWLIRNRFWSKRHRCTIELIQRPDGKVVGNAEPAFHHIGFELQTMGASDVWGLEQEQRALALLGTMIRHVQMKRYVLTGMFLERSVRSGVTYIFRRLKPTVALAPWRDEANGQAEARILACLCLHPIAYYEGSWAGAMCPTDDVIAHLTMMRGDEAMFWKRSSQHPASRPEAGL